MSCYHPSCTDGTINSRDQVKIFFFELEILKNFRFRKFWNSKKFRRKKSSSKICKNLRFFDQNIFKNISQIQLNENGPEGRPGPAGHSSSLVCTLWSIIYIVIFKCFLLLSWTYAARNSSNFTINQQISALFTSGWTADTKYFNINNARQRAENTLYRVISHSPGPPFARENRTLYKIIWVFSSF